MPALARSSLRRSAALASAAVFAAAIIVALGWPGTLPPDSQNQLGQVVNGVVTDWHPPMMVRLWMLVGGSIGSMLVLQVGLHWLGIWALAETLRRRHVGWAWAMLAVGVTPIALKYLLVIQKDTLLASLFIAAFGLAMLSRSRWPSALLGIMGALCRANGVFALPPLFFTRTHRTGTALAIVGSMIVAVALVPLTDVINHRLLHARPTGVARSLQLFDLVGIARFSDDPTVLPPETKGLRRCYTPLFWDTLVEPGCGRPLGQLPATLTRPWLNAIVKHPLAYAQHRLAHFNRTIFLAVPPMQQCVEAPSMHRCDFSRHGKLVDAVTKNALLWPALWLAVGMALLSGPLTSHARALMLSGILYGGAYLLVGVASDFRYFYWTELAVQSSIMLQLGEGGGLSHWRRAAVAGAAVLIVGYGARLALA